MALPFRSRQQGRADWLTECESGSAQCTTEPHAYGGPPGMLGARARGTMRPRLRHDMYSCISTLLSLSGSPRPLPLWHEVPPVCETDGSLTAPFDSRRMRSWLQDQVAEPPLIPKWVRTRGHPPPLVRDHVRNCATEDGRISATECITLVCPFRCDYVDRALLNEAAVHRKAATFTI